MKYLILAATALIGLACSSQSQTIKSLGYDTTNGRVIYSGTNALTFTNSLQFATNARAATRTNLGGTSVGNSVFTATNAAAAATAIGLGTTNDVEFRTVKINLSSGGGDGLIVTNSESSATSVFDDITINELDAETAAFGNTVIVSSSGISFNTNTAAAATRDNLGLGTTNAVTFGNITATGTLGVSNAATFETNVTINGNLSVGSFTTTTPSTWALDATQTAAATNGVLALPSNANVLRITNANTISGVSNGVLGAFYFLINQSGTNVVISNSATITARGATNITLGANQSATLITTTTTNATAH